MEFVTISLFFFLKKGHNWIRSRCWMSLPSEQERLHRQVNFSETKVYHNFSQIPPRLLALTGARLKGKQVSALGLSTHFCKSSLLPKLCQEMAFCKPGEVGQVLMMIYDDDDDDDDDGWPGSGSLHAGVRWKCGGGEPVEQHLVQGRATWGSGCHLR